MEEQQRASRFEAGCTLMRLEAAVVLVRDLGRRHPGGEVAEAKTTIAVGQGDERTEDRDDDQQH